MQGLGEMMRVLPLVTFGDWLVIGRLADLHLLQSNAACGHLGRKIHVVGIQGSFHVVRGTVQCVPYIS